MMEVIQGTITGKLSFIDDDDDDDDSFIYHSRSLWLNYSVGQL